MGEVFTLLEMQVIHARQRIHPQIHRETATCITPKFWSVNTQMETKV